MAQFPATPPSPRQPETAGAPSPRDQALLKLARLMAENPEPEEDAEDVGPLIDVNELAETGPAVRPLKPARRPFRPAAKPKRPASRGLGLLGHLLQALIVLLVIVWVFLLGVLVGRSRPEEKRLAGWLEKAVGWAQPRPAVLNPDAPIQTPPGLGLTPAEPAPAPPGGAPDPAAPASNEPEGLTEAPEPDPAVTESAPADLAGPAGEALTAEPEPLFAVQTALASDATEARQRVAQLASQGFQAYFYQNGPRFYVRVGPFTTRSEAADNLRRLEELGYKSPYISKLR